jgi:hypothetical protein
VFEEIGRHAGKLYAKYSGEVVANDIDPDKTGIISVTVPSVFGAGVSVPARPCLPYGHFFIPAVGTRLWVEFESGDPDYPIWVGVWYPKGTVPKTATISPPDNRVIQTASGHTIEIMDKDGEEQITIKHKGNSFITLDKKGSVLIANKSGSYLQMDADAKAATFVEQHGNIITMGGDGITITEKSGNTTIQMTGSACRVMGGAIILQAPSVSITGDPAAEPTIMGTTFGAAFTPFAVHTHATAVGPTGPPIPPGPLLTPGSPMLTSGTLVK